MRILFIGNYQNGYVGEVSDETHLVREIESLNHSVTKLGRDIWREYVIEGFPQGKYQTVPENTEFDAVIIAKWHHFFDGRFIDKAREKYKCPVFYWVWDYMQGEDWHMSMAKSADLYLGNDVRNGMYKDFKNAYYFPFDVCDGSVKRFGLGPKKYDVIFTGSYLGQGDRIEWLKEINKVYPVTVFSWNFEEWKKAGFTAYPAVYGEEYNRLIDESKIVLGFSVEPNCWGYWSNRVGKVIRAGGFLLQQYAPGMELLIGDKAEYFSSPDEAIKKIGYYLEFEFARKQFIFNASENEDTFTSKTRVKQLMILIERFRKGDAKRWML